MTRAEAIERAVACKVCAGTLCKVETDARTAAGKAYDAALIAGLQRAARIVKRDIIKPVSPKNSGHDALMLAWGAIRAEIQLRKGAKGK